MSGLPREGKPGGTRRRDYKVKEEALGHDGYVYGHEHAEGFKGVSICQNLLHSCTLNRCHLFYANYALIKRSLSLIPFYILKRKRERKVPLTRGNILWCYRPLVSQFPPSL